MNVSKKKWISASIGAGALVLASVGGVAAMTLPASADTSVTTPAQTAKDAPDGQGVEDGTNDGETADDQEVEDGTNDGETADDAPAR